MEKNTIHVRGIFKFLKSGSGYTLIEAIISLGVLLMLTSLVPLILTPIQKQPPLSQLEETTLFFTMLGKEIREAKRIDIQKDNLFITNYNADVMKFSKYHTLIRKQVNGLGHEVWLQNISEMMLKRHSEYLLEVAIVDSNGRKYQRVFRRLE